MRIRSIKPEFWRSQDIADLSVEDRLLFIGLWSYVDDNGVGKDVDALIAADLFALDLSRDPRETFARVSRGLQNLHEAGRITRYVVHGTPYLHVTNWGTHQRVDKPNKPRYPAPTCDDAVIRDTLATPSRDSRETPAPGTGEQGNRGTGEQGSSAPTVRAANAAPPADTHDTHDAADVVDTEPADQTATAQDILGAWLNNQATRPPQRVIGHLAKEIKTLLDEGQPYADVLHAVHTWNSKGLSPSLLPSVLHETRNKTSRPANANERRQAAYQNLAHREAWTPPTPGTLEWGNPRKDTPNELQ